MEYFYDGQIRRYVTQFMRIFIGFKYQAGDGSHTSVPVMYGDMTRQVAAIIKENSENKLSSVPKIACYITGLELDKTRLADATYVSKINIQERDYIRPDEPDFRGTREYKNRQGNSYTVERLMPTPFVLKMKADIWTSNTDQKLQLIEQILVLFNPSLEIQTTDNFIDWTSLSVIDLESTNFSSRTIPAGADSEIDICSLEFKMPIYISPPAKVKRMGVIRDIVMNVFDANGDTGSLNSLIYNGGSGLNLFDQHNTPGRYGVLLLSANIVGNPDRYRVSVLSPTEAVVAMGLDAPVKKGERIDWQEVLKLYSGRHIDGISLIHFKQPSGGEITGSFSIDPLDSTYLDVTLDLDTIPSNSEALNVDAIINPLTFNPRPNISVLPQTDIQYLLIDDIGGGVNETFIAENITTIIETPVRYSLVKNSPDSTTNFEVYVNDQLVDASPIPSSDIESNFRILLDEPVAVGDIVNYRVYINDDGADAWAQWDLSGPAPVKVPKSELIAKANDIVKFNGQRWEIVFNSSTQSNQTLYMTNRKTGIQYRWDGEQWLRSFEGEYSSGFWRFTLS
jgi:hypothetical protein